jgi:hypothetical protein
MKKKLSWSVELFARFFIGMLSMSIYFKYLIIIHDVIIYLHIVFFSPLRVTDSERFRPPRKRPKLLIRTYRLLGFKRTTPDELYLWKLDAEGILMN